MRKLTMKLSWLHQLTHLAEILPRMHGMPMRVGDVRHDVAFAFGKKIGARFGVLRRARPEPGTQVSGKIHQP